MGWVGARRLLIVIFLAVDVFLFSLLQVSGPISSGQGTVATLPPGAVANPLGASVHDLPVVRMRLVSAAQVALTLFGSVPKGVLQANGAIRYQRGQESVSQESNGAVWVVLAPSPAELPVVGQAAAISAAQSLLTALQLPSGLTERTVLKAGSTLSVVFGESVNGVPVAGASAVVVEGPAKDWLVQVRLNQAQSAGGRASLLSAAEAVAYDAATGGTGRVQSMALVYPLATSAWQLLAPQWVLVGPGQTVRIDAFSGEEIP
ncbi:MAG: hypothetical protein ACYCOS_07320 [Sulfobacillus sp.]